MGKTLGIESERNIFTMMNRFDFKKVNAHKVSVSRLLHIFLESFFFLISG